jgi:hypothetical protein
MNESISSDRLGDAGFDQCNAATFWLAARLEIIVNKTRTFQFHEGNSSVDMSSECPSFGGSSGSCCPPGALQCNGEACCDPKMCVLFRLRAIHG